MVIKTLRYIFFTVILVTLAVTFFLLLKNKMAPNAPEPNVGTSSYPELKSPAQSDKIIIKTSGGDIEINNVEKEATKSVKYGNNFEYIIKEDTSGYSISYFPQNQGFIIAISSPEIQKVRETAEADFLNILGVSKEKACLLNVDLGAIYSANAEAAGKNYGLSFCPNGKPFPVN